MFFKLTVLTAEEKTVKQICEDIRAKLKSCTLQVYNIVRFISTFRGGAHNNNIGQKTPRFTCVQRVFFSSTVSHCTLYILAGQLLCVCVCGYSIYRLCVCVRKS